MLIKVISCGICGSDIVEWYRLPRAPLVQGQGIYRAEDTLRHMFLLPKWALSSVHGN
jgi:threonine dehydrogenase-like Zn-dependent dehydrogenase